MAMGMSYHEFWHGDYTQWKYWEEMHQRRLNEKNELLWLQGAYYYDAVSVALANIFSSKGKAQAKYMEEPIRITPMTEEEQEAEKKKQVEQFRSALELLGRRFEAKHKRERGDLDGGGNR